MLERMRRRGAPALTLPAVALALAAPAAAAESARQAAEGDRPWPETVLVTNDDGVDDPGIAALARAFAPAARTLVVAPLEDRSGTTNFLTLGFRTLEVAAEERSLGPGIEAYGLDGYPADCVLFAVQGPLEGEKPDLVISGINGGTNLGPAWFASGTVGAARMAALLGIPAIAVSGLDDAIPGAAEAVAAWVVELARSPAARGLGPGQYLTVSLPRVAPGEIAGVDAVRHAGLDRGAFPRFVAAGGEGNRRIWRAAAPPGSLAEAGSGDAAAVAAHRIAVVPMAVDEHDLDLLRRLRERPAALPPWPGTAEGAATPP